MDDRLQRIKELFSESEKRNGELSHENFELKKRIAELGEIDIVRCKECEKWEEIKGTRYGYCGAYKLGFSPVVVSRLSPYWDINIQTKTEADHFCAYGERIGDNEYCNGI